MWRESRMAVALRVARTSAPSLRTVGTALTTLAFIPLLEVALLVTVARSFDVPGAATVAYAGFVVSALGMVVGQVVGAVVRDRGIGVVEEALAVAPWSLTYWGGKLFLPAGIALLTSAMGCLVVWAVEPSHSARVLGVALLGVFMAVLVGCCVGLACCAVALTGRDPFMAANVLGALLPVTAGVIAPLSSYPGWLQPVSAVLPGTWLVQWLRDATSGQASAWPLVAEASIAIAWALGGVAGLYVAWSRMRSGKYSGEVL
ncbi:ABC transporter permease [Corynebacterium lowii]|uniref:ABC-2 type transporter n=1 Tax=Corynebacterium lowii TaxID=1544413 RepID=A0A0Q0UGF0_9CORY|nr:ABC transporter permease [Corynebacterium lowii]KQB87443.1 ABC-2 type transporter [Corynebacterium lowii]MDP9851965.1 ABC-2 type transport system permease protein [Corynebacterium lowii]